ncbi:DNA alkylation repair protein [Chitinophaga nivalis]|uniref:DNA alkylation repair protein n=1 Tax=Chitinophaga nivalis TaxID=2991709 RepID=A0ABT3IUI1_9BACT|nr:DNA alkylation repair protein [Chitinophaga nivalis]MCW3462662.1 DNA alkylation repair protein [Chitinophaga nivalis]MCW3487647.1 DNA alkylation repair protein [Chitinophaga nivalis]
MDYLRYIREAYTNAANPDQAVAMKQYMRNQFEHLGIATPVRRQLNKELKALHGLPPIEQMPALIKALWALPEREYHHAAIDFMQLSHKQWTDAHIHLFEYMITHQSWWDTVDGIVSCLAGPWLKRFASHQPGITDRWINSENIWLQRSALIFQHGYKQDTDEQLLYRYILQCAGSKEFFLQKAIGWSLREYGKVNPASVIRFVNSHDLAPLSRREALRRIT